MIKDQLQKEMLEKVKPGVKPSDLKKKLKRSKSVGDIPQAPTLPITIESLQDEISVLALQLETTAREKLELETENKQLKKQARNNPPTALLTDQLKQKQKQIEELRAKLETENTTAELDTSLFARHKGLKD